MNSPDTLVAPFFMNTFSSNPALCAISCSTYLACHGQITFRSVAYVGSDIQRYKDAALVLHDAKLGKLPPGTSALMQQVMSPSATAHVLAGCFNRTSDLCTSVVPANVSQKQIVLNLQGGLEAIQGPPGTVKSERVATLTSVNRRQKHNNFSHCQQQGAVWEEGEDARAKAEKRRNEKAVQARSSCMLLGKDPD
eukprot:1138730-Pelagomonas_calceolata.AAC.4